MSWLDFPEGDIGGIGLADINRAREKGYSESAIQEELERAQASGMPVGDAALASVKDGPQGMTGFEYDYQQSIDLANINASIQNMVNQSNEYIAQIQSGAATDVATINAGATNYAADRQLEATEYVADREKETALGVENIRSQGALDLQGVVNAGLEAVEEIRGKSAENVADITGQFGLQGEKIKGETARDVAEIDFKKGLYGSLISAFSF